MTETTIDGRRRRRVSDDRILAAAAAEFAERGLEGASLVAIAERAATTRPTLYANFGSKEDLFAATIRHEAQALRDQLLSTYARYDARAPETLLRAGIQAIFDFAAQRPAGFRLLLGGRLDVPRDDPAVSEVHDEIIAAVTGLIRPRLSGRGKDHRARAFAVMVIGLLAAAARDAAERGDDFDDAAALAYRFLAPAFAAIS